MSMGRFLQLLRRLATREASSQGHLPLQEQYPQYAIGRESYADGNLVVRTWTESATLSIGAFCSIGHGVQILLGGEHRTDWVTTFPFNVLWPVAKGIPGHPATKGNVTIGNDVWIGAEATILSGVTVGDGAVIGMRALVSRNVPAYAIVAGVPASVRRMRFEPSVVEQLQALRWWDWPDDRIERFLPLMLSNDIAAFIEAARAEGTRS